MKDQQRLQHCKEVSSQLGFSREGQNRNIPLSLHPFVTKKSNYDYYCHLQTIWQKVLLRVSQDKRFLINLLSPLAQNDRLLQGNLEILMKMNGRPLNEGACLSRIDYFEDQTGQQKITEYNLNCVGCQAPNEIVQQKRQQFQKDNSYFNNCIAERQTEAVCELAKLKNNPGIVLYVTFNLQQLQSQDFCRYDWWKFQQQFSKKQTKIVATNLKLMAEKLSLRENGDLYYGEDRVAIVYYRTIFRISDYMFGQEGDIERSFAAKEMANRSNAINIPPIEFELINLKRVQTELGKPEVLRRYATEQQAEMLIKTRVEEWDFDAISKEQFQSLRVKVQAKPNNYILKPNREGGSNNIHGRKIIDILRDEGQNLSSYILMQTIDAKVHKNIIIEGQAHFDQNLNYEIGIYGSLTWTNGQIIRNQADGYMIKAKSSQSNEGGLSIGFGRLVLWKFDENDN